MYTPHENNCLHRVLQRKVMRSQLVMCNEMQICTLLRNINFCTCYKVCSVQRIEVVLSTTRNFFLYITGIVVDCVIEFNVDVLQNSSHRYQ
jgi:hypothetical protein